MKGKLRLVSVISLVALLGLLAWRYPDVKKAARKVYYGVHLSARTRYEAYSFTVHHFNDLNALHVASAKARGIQPIPKNSEVEAKAKDYHLVRVGNSENYRLKRMTHSYPYLVPEARQLLNDIGTAFQRNVKEKKLPKHCFMITSLLRTEETQDKLSGNNENASKNSAHLYATTFDISYKEFLTRRGKMTRDDRVRKALIEAVDSLRKQNRCYVVTEKNQACFHITVR